MKNNDGLVERLRALHVWPQFVADEHADHGIQRGCTPLVKLPTKPPTPSSASAPN